jgi:hypothetical protein
MSFRSLLAVTVLTLLTAGVLSAAVGPLDGRTYEGETGVKGKTKGETENFVFTAQVFDPVYSHLYGFHSAPYTVRAQGGKTVFESETKSEEQGTMRWKGTLQGETLSGTMVWTRPGQKPVEHWFKGTLKK